MIDVSSKISLKLSCINACHGDIAKGKELYDFLAEGVETIPDIETPKPSVLRQAQETIGSIFGWVKENKDDIVQAVGFVQSLRNPASSVTAVNDIPPIIDKP